MLLCSALSAHTLTGHARPAESSARYAVYDLVEDGPPRTFIEAAERGDDSYIIKTIERTLDFNINQTVGPASQHTPAQLRELQASTGVCARHHLACWWRCRIHIFATMLLPVPQLTIGLDVAALLFAGPHRPFCPALGG